MPDASPEGKQAQAMGCEEIEAGPESYPLLGKPKWLEDDFSF